MKKPLRVALLGALGVATITAAFFAGRARAAGIPDADVLTYTGYLEDGNGAPLTGDHSIEVQFLDAADATSELCGGSLDSATLQSGRFQVPLPVECVDAVKANPNLWVEVKVDGASLGPTKLGAVPFALEAGHALTADEAVAASGALANELDDLTTAINDVEEGQPKITAWTSFTPTLTTHAGTPVTGTTGVGAKWRRVGDSVEVQVAIGFNASSASNEYLTLPLPAGLVPTGSLGTVGAAGGWNGSAMAICTVTAYAVDKKLYMDCQGQSSMRRSAFGPVGSGIYSLSASYTVQVEGWTLTAP